MEQQEITGIDVYIGLHHAAPDSILSTRDEAALHAAAALFRENGQGALADRFEALANRERTAETSELQEERGLFLDELGDVPLAKLEQESVR